MGKKEIVIVGKMEGLAFPLQLSSESLSAFYSYIDESLLASTTLVLSYRQISQFPTNAFTLVHLQHLGLNNNQLQTIPDTLGNLTYLQRLGLDNNQLQTIPDTIGNLTYLQYLRLDNNQLQTIPECLYRLPRTCAVRLEGNPIPQEFIEQARTRINAEGFQGPRFFFSIHERPEQHHQPHDLRTILPEWCEDPCKQALQERLSLEQQSNLANWLARLKGTADYTAQEQAVKNKVKHLLTWLAEETNADHLQPAYQILADATRTCGDRVALSFNTLSLHVKICQSSILGIPELKSLIIGAERYDRLKKIAEQKCQQLRLVDPIEVHLCYESKLKEPLGLPIEINHMLYERLSGVTEEDIENAKCKLLAETGPNQQIDILLQHPMWKKALENSPEFNQIKEICSRLKEEALSQLDFEDDSAMIKYEKEFNEKDKTVWNPYYLLTKQIVEPTN